MSAVLKIGLALAAFAQGVIAFSPATRLTTPRTVAAANQMSLLSYDWQAYASGGYGGIMVAAMVDYLSGPTEFGSSLIVGPLKIRARLNR